jgi:hypothetical protein
MPAGIALHARLPGKLRDARFLTRKLMVDATNKPRGEARRHTQLQAVEVLTKD